MREVAALAGVSIKTVSRVINAEPEVSMRLRSRVQVAAEQLLYRHNLNASSLRRTNGKSATIGLLLGDVANPFSSHLHREIENAALDRGVLVFAGSSDEDEGRERRLISAFTAHRVDGLVIVAATRDYSFLASEQRAGTAIVFVDRPPCFLESDSVLSDNVDGSRSAVSHLIAHGHERIGYLGDLTTIATAAERYRGYVEELNANGLRTDTQMVKLDLRDAGAAEAAATQLLLVAKRPTALFASQNFVTIGAYRALSRLGLERKVALVGFDDILLADLLEPGITVVAQDPATIARLATTILFRRIDGDRSPSVEEIVPTRLIVRGSGEIQP